MSTLLTSAVLVEAATFFNIPLSNTQALSSAVFGASISYKSKFVSLKPFLVTIINWVIAPVVSFVIGLVLGEITFSSF